ncbi:uncharacterized protein NPIL_441061 [Nephila pilipes]|uniref:Uncharacterized protein n=1 Tax=Nephila pilipes TaxID=299642 RepID=A0A8X6TUF8_NEPPI|nr:uncharacterized protein NPIL_441061 [Nephila pilipes]
MDFQSAMETFAEAWVAYNTQTPLTEAAETQGLMLTGGVVSGGTCPHDMNPERREKQDGSLPPDPGLRSPGSSSTALSLVEFRPSMKSASSGQTEDFNYSQIKNDVLILFRDGTDVDSKLLAGDRSAVNCLQTPFPAVYAKQRLNWYLRNLLPLNPFADGNCDRTLIAPRPDNILAGIIRRLPDASPHWRLAGNHEFHSKRRVACPSIAKLVRRQICVALIPYLSIKQVSGYTPVNEKDCFLDFPPTSMLP